MGFRLQVKSKSYLKDISGNDFIIKNINDSLYYKRYNDSIIIVSD